mgnify:CR=1 FL=1
MSIGMKSRTKVKSKKARTSETSRPRTQELEQAASHVVGKPAEVEPRESSALPAEAPEAAMQSSEAPDAGYGRCTESSDWENRGRS